MNAYWYRTGGAPAPDLEHWLVWDSSSSRWVMKRACEANFDLPNPVGKDSEVITCTTCAYFMAATRNDFNKRNA